ncbi:tRNA (adenosine(37)-N6)-threonylcarbamoyltransferase complex ATPase subunit type 1 TsaE [Clostridia bacterium]|nr:tRNA (adenosine(37)-N6)-threonylcarbamoyltransferase complex ATPase subunit type 1 TsaE [Clostridia bacterium]
MKKRTLWSESALHTKHIGEMIGQAAEPGDVVLFTGDLGAGKTTMSQGIASGLGIDTDVTSPTFTLMQIYQGDLTLYHLDVYRLNSEAEATDIGLEEVLYGDGLCLIEWADQFPELWPDDYLLVRIERQGDMKRRIELTGAGMGEEYLGRVAKLLESAGIQYESA